VPENLRVFRHVGFFCFGVAELLQRPRDNLGQSQKGSYIMYIGGGLLTLVVIIVLVMIVMRN
jgi:hypothetical protein